MSKNKWIGIIALVVALIIVAVVIIVALDPFGSKSSDEIISDEKNDSEKIDTVKTDNDKIEGEWYWYSLKRNGEEDEDNDRDADGNIAILNFSEDGTVTIAQPAPSYYDEEYLYGTAPYSYSGGKITFDGETLDCKISGNRMTWTGIVDGDNIKAELKR